MKGILCLVLVILLALCSVQVVIAAQGVTTVSLLASTNVINTSNYIILTLSLFMIAFIPAVVKKESLNRKLINKSLISMLIKRGFFSSA